MLNNTKTRFLFKKSESGRNASLFQIMDGIICYKDKKGADGTGKQDLEEERPIMSIIPPRRFW